MRIFAALVVGFFGLSSSLFADQTTERKGLDALSDSIHALTKVSLSCEKDSDCRVISIGYKACGGSHHYEIASEQNPVMAEIKLLAYRLETKEKRFNQTYGIISDCMIRSAPSTTCKDNLCKQTEKSFDEL